MKLPGGAALLHFETIDSTNAEAHRLAAAPPELPLWIWADEQTQGRGRQGRNWVSERGNLFATYLCEIHAPPDVLPQAALVAAVAARKTLAEIAPAVDIRIKWPNDILANGAKICGILCETVSQKPTLLAMGFGMNIGRAPAASTYPVTSLETDGVSAKVESVLQKLDVSLRESLALWNKGRGFEQLRQAWLSHAAGLGEVARVSLGNKSESGIFRDLAPNGALVLERQDGSRIEVISGEVWLEGVEALRRAKGNKVSA